MSALRLLIVDDFPQVREDLRTALTLTGGIVVVGEASNGQEAVDLAARLRPDVVLLDLEMPVLDGYETARQVRARCPGCRVVALSVHGDDEARRKAIEAGVAAFVVKGAALEALKQALSGR